MFTWFVHQNRTLQVAHTIPNALLSDDTVRVKVYRTSGDTPDLDISSDGHLSGGTGIDFEDGETEFTLTLMAADTEDLIAQTGYNVEVSIVDADGVIQHVERGVAFIHATPGGDVSPGEHSSQSQLESELSSSSSAYGVLGYNATSNVYITGDEPYSIFGDGSGYGGLLLGANTWRIGESVYVEASGDYTTVGFPAGSLAVVIAFGAVNLTINVTDLPPSQTACQWQLSAKFTRRTYGASGKIVGKAVLTLVLMDSTELAYRAALPETVLSSTASYEAEVTFQFSNAANEINVIQSTVTKRNPLE